MRHVYVHVPFCARRCTYCDFAIAVRKRVPTERYVDAVLAEYTWRREQSRWDDAPLETFYLGGGTPSLLSPDAVSRLVTTILDAGHRTPDTEHREITLEANPEDVTPDLARAWRDAGINRVSLGAQSFDPAVLAWMHRTHAAERTAQAVAVLRDAGGMTVSLDLIFARPEGMAGSFRADLECAVQLEPEHLSVYGLTLEPKTALARQADRGDVRPAPEERYAAEFLLAHELLGAAGFDHYEVSNYARAGFQARHNRIYWLGRSYAGLGPSAHSYNGARRWWNVRDWAAYDRVLARGGDPTAGSETLNPDQQRLERTYLGLRVSDGVAAADLDPANVQRAVQVGWVQMADGQLRPAPEGWLRLDELVAVLTTSAEGG